MDFPGVLPTRSVRPGRPGRTTSHVPNRTDSGAALVREPHRGCPGIRSLSGHLAGTNTPSGWDGLLAFLALSDTSKYVNEETSTQPEHSNEPALDPVAQELASGVPTDPAARRRAMSALLRGLLAPKRGA